MTTPRLLLADLNDKKIGIIGYGKEGQATLRAIEKYAPDAQVTLVDRGEITTANHHEIITGAACLRDIKTFDIVIRSPGIHPKDLSDAKAITSATQLFLDETAARGAMVIGVTGSKGKSTTSSLITAIAKAAGMDVHLVGNIGEPALDHLPEEHTDAIFVMELSSYQLMDITTSPRLAIITRIFPEHLDYHGSLEAYLEAKANICRFQSKTDLTVFNIEDPDSTLLAKRSGGITRGYRMADAIIDIGETKLIGAHNLQNIAGACVVAHELGIAEAIVRRAVRAFSPLPHRLQSLDISHGIEWIDDAISTTPDSTIAALEALGDRVKVLIIGGKDRGLDFSELTKRLKTSAVGLVILLGETSKRLQNEFLKSTSVASMADAINTAKAHVSNSNSNSNPLPIVLLSPAAPSYDQYKNFEDKGKDFANCIKQLR